MTVKGTGWHVIERVTAKIEVYYEEDSATTVEVSVHNAPPRIAHRERPDQYTQQPYEEYWQVNVSLPAGTCKLPPHALRIIAAVADEFAGSLDFGDEMDGLEPRTGFQHEASVNEEVI